VSALPHDVGSPRSDSLLDAGASNRLNAESVMRLKAERRGLS